MAVVGRIPIKINHQEAVNARDIDVEASRNQVIHKFSNGQRDRSKGQPSYTFTITFSCPEDKQQFVQLSDGGIDDDDAVGFTLNYLKGGEEYMLLDCGLNSDKTSSDQDGKADQTISGVATYRERVS
jgi:hypothetical protein